MVETNKTDKTKTTTSKVAEKETPKKDEIKKEPVKTNDNAKETPETKTKGNGQTIVIIILAGVLVFTAIVFAVLFATGVIKVGNSDRTVTERFDRDDDDDFDDDDRGGRKRRRNDSDDSEKGNTIDNPNPQVKEDNATKVHVGDLEFYLPRQFKYGGKNKDGAMTYNLEDDDGWASVSVYSERTSLSPSEYLNKISSYLDITDQNYQMNGTTWVQAETASTLAYATKLDGKIYAVYYAVKLDSDTTGKAMQMIPKTLYMKKIIKE